MIKLVVTDLDGTFLNNKGSYDVELFKKVYAEMQQKESLFCRMYRETM